MENWTLTWTKLLPLELETIREIKDNIPGVYRFSYKEGNNYYVFYVGQAKKNIKERIFKHFSGAGGNDCVGYYLTTKKECFLRYTQITRDYVRDSTERQVYDNFTPACNEIRPGGRDDIKVKVNLN